MRSGGFGSHKDCFASQCISAASYLWFGEYVLVSLFCLMIYSWGMCLGWCLTGYVNLFWAPKIFSLGPGKRFPRNRYPGTVSTNLGPLEQAN